MIPYRRGVDVANFSITSTAYFRPDEEGPYKFGLAVVGRGRLYVNERLVSHGSECLISDDG